MAARLTNEAPLASELDIVLSFSNSGNGSKFLKSWFPYFRPYHIIIIQGESNATALDVPADLDHEIFTLADVRKILGPKADCVSSGSEVSKCFGWLVSKKKYILTVADDCIPATHPTTKDTIDAVEKHAANLQSPSTPFFFNTLYDPFHESTDFVRGYPFSLREGAPTAISHGLWLNFPDYDTPTQLVKPLERNTRYADFVVTVPKGSLYSMSSLSLAFDRDLIGPAMFFPIIGSGSSVAFHSDIWAGWCTKVICDHIGIGVKTGLPYVHREKKTDAFATLKKEYSGLVWQDEAIPFFEEVKFSKSATTASACFKELALQVKEKLGKVDPFFLKVAESMVAWLSVWEEYKSQ